mgnify:FL=1|jgi:hypothetical protein
MSRYDTWKTTPPDEPDNLECYGCDGKGSGCRRCGSSTEECCCGPTRDLWVCEDCEGAGR